MPTYEYRCNDCEEIFEVFQRIIDVPLRECPVCGGELKKIISGGVGIIFKGSGFYTTDHKPSSSSSSSVDSLNESPSKEKSEDKNKSADTSSISQK